jgi:hypothetical protein
MELNVEQRRGNGRFAQFLKSVMSGCGAVITPVIEIHDQEGKR